MKTKIFLISIVSCLFLQANAQIFDNTIVNDNSSWAILSYGIGYDEITHEEVICCVKTQKVYFGEDLIIASISYKEVFSCNDTLNEVIKYEGLIREEEKKTYFIPENSETEYLLYDFSLEEGMSFEYIDPWHEMSGSIPFYAKHVDFIEINGIQKKRIQLSIGFTYDENAPIQSTWIEGLGSLCGLFSPSSILAPGGSKTLLCYYQDDELIYKNPDYSECYYDDPESITSVQTILADNYNVFPNPTDGQLYITDYQSNILGITMYNMNGKLVWNNSNSGNSNEIVIDISSQPAGIYFLRIQTKDGLVTRKVVKR